MSSLFGVELPTPVNFIVAFAFVLLLIGAAAWLVRRFGATRMEAAARGRQPRIAVIDSAAVDGRRKLVIIRRDNVEHLLMIGGPSDVVVETNIVRGAAVTAREAPAGRNGAEATPRAMPLPDPTPWPLQPEPVLTPVPHTVRTSARSSGDGAWHAPAVPTAAPVPEVRPVRHADTLAGLAEELGRPASEPATVRAVHAPPKVQPQAEPQPKPSRPTPPPAATGLAPQSSATADQSLAEMAQRLEAALRRPTAQKVAPEMQRVTATLEVKPEPPKTGAQPHPGTQPKPQQQSNLEQEMASLLSRPGKT